MDQVQIYAVTDETGDGMLRTWTAPAILLATLGLCASVRAQDPASLGDLARQLRKDKTNPSAAKVVTNDDIAASKDSGSPGFGAQAPGSAESAQAAIEKIQATINKLDSMDRATLVKMALQGQDADFQGRVAWENKLWDAKQTYVTRGKETIEKSKQILLTAQKLRESRDGQILKPDDPKVQNFLADLRQFVQNSMRADAAFQAVVMEGWDLVKENAPKETTLAQP